jgi:hypothetical protein
MIKMIKMMIMTIIIIIIIMLSIQQHYLPMQMFFKEFLHLYHQENLFQLDLKMVLFN